jgi:hypothetical protein
VASEAAASGLWRQHAATHSTHSIRVRIGHSPNGFTERQSAHSGLMPANLITLALALERIGVSATMRPSSTGSGYDLIGTAAVGLRSYWLDIAALKTGARD